MAAASNSDEQPTRPVVFDRAVGWAEGAGMEQQQLSALQHVQANHAARQAAAVPDISPQASQQTKTQQGIERSLVTAESIAPSPNTGHGPDRSAGRFAELSAATPAKDAIEAARDAYRQARDGTAASAKEIDSRGGRSTGISTGRGGGREF